MNTFFLLSAGTNDIKAGLIEATNNVTDIAMFIVNYVVVPLAAMFLTGLLIFLIVKVVKMNKAHENHSQVVGEIVLVVVGLTLILSFPFWGWKMLGRQDVTTSSATTAVLYDVGRLPR